MAVLRLALLGTFEARLDSVSAVTFPRKKSEALLAYLALQPGRMIARDKLAALLWGDASDERARHSLRQALVTLRQALPRAAAACLVEEGDNVGVSPTAVEVDVTRFEALATAASPEALERAAALYRGDLLEGMSVAEPPFEEWLRAERERLRELAIESLAKLLAHHARTDAVEHAVQTAVRLLGLEPAQEAVHRTLMRLYARQNRRGAALRQYQACVGVLERELGVEPEAETRQFYRDLLQTRPHVSDDVEPRRLGSPVLTSDTALVGRTALQRSLAERAHQDQRLDPVVGSETRTDEAHADVVERVGDVDRPRARPYALEGGARARLKRPGQHDPRARKRDAAGAGKIPTLVAARQFPAQLATLLEDPQSRGIPPTSFRRPERSAPCAEHRQLPRIGRGLAVVARNDHFVRRSS